MKLFPRCLSVLIVALCLPALADEGMWTYDSFPAQKVKEKYGFEPSAEWLDHLRLASVRIAGGCSASIVSSQGLVMTNHHCARGCVENISSLSGKDYNRDGFFARRLADERNCPSMELNQLVEIANVTEQVQSATRDVGADRFSEVQRSAIAAIEKQCATSSDLRCEVVSLFRGGRYDLYRYRRFQDIRLVFAPEDGVAFFGGDPDNFNFPRYDLDVSFVRIYGADGKPMATKDHLAWSDGSLREGDVTFVSGNPGGTSREQDDGADRRRPRRAPAEEHAVRGRAARLHHRVPAPRPEQKRYSEQPALRLRELAQGDEGRTCRTGRQGVLCASSPSASERFAPRSQPRPSSRAPMAASGTGSRRWSPRTRRCATSTARSNGARCRGCSRSRAVSSVAPTRWASRTASACASIRTRACRRCSRTCSPRDRSMTSSRSRRCPGR